MARAGWSADGSVGRLVPLLAHRLDSRPENYPTTIRNVVGKLSKLLLEDTTMRPSNPIPGQQTAKSVDLPMDWLALRDWFIPANKLIANCGIVFPSSE
jgi:hypothetical protein